MLEDAENKLAAADRWVAEARRRIAELEELEERLRQARSD